MREVDAYSKEAGGRFLHGRRYRKMGRCLAVIILLAWDGLLMYMIVECLIEPVYGAAFVAAISVWLGMKL